MCFFIFIFILSRSLFDWPITKRSESLEVPPISKSIYSEYKIILRAYPVTYSKSDPFLETLLKGKMILAEGYKGLVGLFRFSFPRHLV
jgi:hypothetical protein